MPATQRRENKSVIQQLLDEPYRFQFFQAVRLVVQWLGENGVSADKALNDHVRFDNSLMLSFQPGQIEALHARGAAEISTQAEMIQALLEGQNLQIQITPSFMGFLGANGALPHHYTERIVAHQLTEKDAAPRAFFDMFSNRVLALFYEAWCKYRFERAIGDGKDTLLPLLLSLAGYQPQSVENKPHGLCDEVIGLYAGVLQQRPVSALILGRMLSSYFGVPIEIEENAGCWIALERKEQCSLGGLNATLGDNTILGQSSWRPDLGARLRIGPLSRSEFRRFLPSGAAADALEKMLGLFGNQTLTYEIQLVLRAEDIHQLCLGGGIDIGGRLGHDSFLVTATSEADRCDMSYTVQPLAPLQPPRAAQAGR
jgi:type VI secretion system protein ImpH